jgi:flagellar M-ring protein FliF
VQVAVDLDMNRVSKTSEVFDPNGQVVRSTQTRDLANSAVGPGESGQVSVSTELPGATQGTTAGGTSEQGSTTEETTNYEISKTTATELTEAGGVKRLSIAVVVDGTYTTDANGNSTYTPRDQATLDQLTQIVRSAVGFDAARGDQVQVSNLQFADRPELGSAGTSAPGLFDFTRDDLMNAAQMAVTLLIALALVFFVMRPLLRKVLSPEGGALALPQSAEIHGNPGAVGPGNFGSAPVNSQLPNLSGADINDPTVAAEANPRVPAWMNSARQMGEQQAQTLRTVGTLVDENPKQAALIVRDWLANAS